MEECGTGQVATTTTFGDSSFYLVIFFKTLNGHATPLVFVVCSQEDMKRQRRYELFLNRGHTFRNLNTEPKLKNFMHMERYCPDTHAYQL